VVRHSSDYLLTAIRKEFNMAQMNGRGGLPVLRVLLNLFMFSAVVWGWQRYVLPVVGWKARYREYLLIGSTPEEVGVDAGKKASYRQSDRRPSASCWTCFCYSGHLDRWTSTTCFPKSACREFTGRLEGWGCFGTMTARVCCCSPAHCGSRRNSTNV